VNFGRAAFSSKWLVYHERVQSSSVFIRDATPVTPYQLLLFGGAIGVHVASGTVALDGGWASFTAPPKVAVLFREIRASLDRVLLDKVASPNRPIAELGETVVRAILQLLDSEPAK